MIQANRNLTDPIEIANKSREALDRLDIAGALNHESLLVYHI